MKKQKVVWLGKNVEKGEQLENEEFRKQYFIGCGQKVEKLENQECREKKVLMLVVRRVSSYKQRQDEKISNFVIGSE